MSRLPLLEHTASSVYPDCVGDKCLLRISVFYPRGGTRIAGIGPPYPLAILSPGFLVSSDSYQSYAERLASWGYVCILYDKRETVNDPVNDDVTVRLLRELIDWATTDPALSKLCDTKDVFLVGHSRGAKVSTLAAVSDPRVKALALIDPVDNTQYAPLGPGYPSATQALKSLRMRAAHPTMDGRGGGPLGPLPIVIIGAGVASDCVPLPANYDAFYQAAPGAAWTVVIEDAGHFSFLDSPTMLQAAICTPGLASGPAVRAATQAMIVAWAEVVFRGRAMQPSTSGRERGSGGRKPPPRLASADRGAGGVSGNASTSDGETQSLASWPSPVRTHAPELLQSVAAGLAQSLAADIAAMAAAAGPQSRAAKRARDSKVPVLKSSFKGIPETVDA